MKLLQLSCSAALAAATVGAAQADITWTAATDNNLFTETNWDLTNSTVTAVDPNVTISDNVVIANTMAPAEIPDLAGGQFRFQVDDGFKITLDNAETAYLGNDGIGCFPNPVAGITIEVTNNSHLRTFFVVNEVTVEIDATSEVTFGGGGNPVNLSFIDMTTGSVLNFVEENPTEFTNEHLSKVTVDGAPAVIGVNLDVVSDGLNGSVVTVIPQTLGTNYCAANTNSTGVGATMVASGSSSVAANDVVLMCEDMPNNAFAFFLTSTNQGLVMNPGGSQGNLCVGGSIGRYVGAGQIQNSGSAGAVSLAIDLNQHPTPTGLISVMPGQSWNFQCWFRDVDPMGNASSNFSDGLEIGFN